MNLRRDVVMSYCVWVGGFFIRLLPRSSCVEGKFYLLGAMRGGVWLVCGLRVDGVVAIWRTAFLLSRVARFDRPLRGDNERVSEDKTGSVTVGFDGINDG